jgi:hypothetical protein
VERLRYLQVADLPGRPVGVTLAREEAAVEQHAHRLDGVEGDAFRALEDPLPQVIRQAWDEAFEQLLHRRGRERLERERRRIATRRAEAGSPLAELRTGERKDEEGIRP